MRAPATSARRSALAFAVALVAVDLAACADHAALPTGVPNTGPLAEKNVGAPSGTYGITSAGRTPTPVSGNTTDGRTGTTPSTICSSIVQGSTASDQLDGSSSVAGYRFTVSSDGTQLAFSPIGGGTPPSTIVAVLVKGGPGYDVYTYAGTGITSDNGLVSPPVGNNNIPSISHFVVCTTPTPPSIKKTLVAVYGPDMRTQVTPMSSNGMVMYPFPANQLLWLTYRIDYTTPVASTITDDEQNDCNLANTNAYAYGGGSLRSQFTCSTNGFNATIAGSMDGGLKNPTGSINVPAGSGTLYITVDVKGNGYCGDRRFPNTAVMSAAGRTLGSSTVETWLWPGTMNCK